MRRVLLTLLALSLVVAGACGDGDKKADDDLINTDDSPSAAGPPAPAGATTTTAASTGGRQIAAPWPAPTRNVSALIRRAGLPALPSEVLDYHVHSHLDVFVDGKSQAVPANLGIDLSDRVISPLHTHDETGLIHIENDKKEPFYLGQLFKEWDVRLDASCIGSYCAPATPVKYYVDGVEETGDPTKIEFDYHRQISIVIGTPPATIPAKYEFAPNT